MFVVLPSSIYTTYNAQSHKHSSWLRQRLYHTEQLLEICKSLCTENTQTQPVYKCANTGCNFETESSKQLSIHEANHNSKIYKCEPCQLLYESISKLQTHVHATHLGSKIYICGIDSCPKSYDTIESVCIYRNSSLIHSNSQFQCYKCQLKFTAKQHLTMHLNLPQCPSMKLYKYRCTTCTRKFVYLKNAQKHEEKCATDTLNVRKLTVSAKKSTSYFQPSLH